jgi:hypothetical protein
MQCILKKSNNNARIRVLDLSGFPESGPNLLRKKALFTGRMPAKKEVPFNYYPGNLNGHPERSEGSRNSMKRRDSSHCSE